MERFQDCSLETAFLLQIEDPISPNTISADEIPDNEYLERLLQIETELMDFDSVNEGTVSAGPESSTETELSPGMIQATQEKVDHVLAEENLHLKRIQEEMMEESSVTDLLVMGAEAVEAQNWDLSSTIIAKLNNLLNDRENGDNSFNRLALFFTQGLLYKSIDAPELFQETVTRQQNNLSALQVIQELSPYVKFAHFTANQAILEATQGDQEIHVIDFDIMEGIQWPPLMVDLAMRKDVSLRVTAIITDQQNGATVQQTGRRLKEFADSIHFPFIFDQMVMVREQDFQAIKSGHTLIANCMIHQLHMLKKIFTLVKVFLDGVTKLSPKIVILVEEELLSFTRASSMSFVEFFCEALHHYTALSESLVSSFCREYNIGLRQIEKEFLGIRILDSLIQFPCANEKKMLWRDGFAALREYKPINFSSCNIAQAKFLVGLFSGGYWVQHEKFRLSLCWKSKPLTSASIWVPISTSR